MPREKSSLPGGPRIGDRALLGVLAENIPAADVAAAVLGQGRQSKRNRALPAELTVLYVVALSLYRDVAYEEVLACVMEGLRWLNLPGYATATKGAITQARTRLGKDPLRVLYERLARPLALAGTRGAFYRDWLTVAFDGTTFTVPDSKENAAAFGYAGSERHAS